VIGKSVGLYFIYGYMARPGIVCNTYTHESCVYVYVYFIVVIYIYIYYIVIFSLIEEV